MVLPLALSFLGNLVVALFLLICVALILIVLLQKGRGSGLGGAFGGGAAGSLLGTKTGDFLTWVTICLVALFLVMAVLMGKFMRPTGVTPVPPPQHQLTVPEGTEPAPILPEAQPQTAPEGEQPTTGNDAAGEQEAVQETDQDAQ